MASRGIVGALLFLIHTVGFSVAPVPAQSRPTTSPETAALYQRLLLKIDQIKIFDHHAHPANPDDPDVDAMAVPPGTTALRLRETNPELVAAAKALFAYPYADLSGEHARWLIDKKSQLKKEKGREYFSWILDRLGIETSVANRVAMPDYLDAKRFPWVFFVDAFMFPLDNALIAARNPDQAVYIPMQEKVLQHYLREAGLSRRPDSLPEYLTFVTRMLEDYKQRGGIAQKFEAAYFRSLRFEDPSQAAVDGIYRKYNSGGTPTNDEYTLFQDYVFRYLIAEGGRLGLPVHIHSAVGAGDYFSITGGNALNLENILKDPRYGKTTFVLIHGGYPFERQAIWLASMKNVYLDSSELELLLYPEEFKKVLRHWLEVLPDKITFGSDAFPYSEALGVEECYWLGVKTARTALAGALAEMVAAGEISEKKALDFARDYLHDTAARLYR